VKSHGKERFWPNIWQNPDIWIKELSVTTNNWGFGQGFVTRTPEYEAVVNISVVFA